MTVGDGALKIFRKISTNDLQTTAEGFLRQHACEQ
jgi:hypothetical protein